MRVCRICNKEKPLRDFYFRKDSKTYRHDCKACFYETQSKWRRSHLEINRAKHRRFYWNHLEMMRKRGKENTYKTKYGITIDQKRQMYREQNGKCAICEKMMATTHNCMVDHDHKTKAVRALLCVRCNSGLSFLEDTKYVEKALNYLKKYGKL